MFGEGGGGEGRFGDHQAMTWRHFFEQRGGVCKETDALKRVQKVGFGRSFNIDLPASINKEDCLPPSVLGAWRNLHPGYCLLEDGRPKRS